MIMARVLNGSRGTQALAFAVCGLGRAGAARVRDLQALAGVELVATVSRRAGIGSHAWPQVLADPRITCVIVATENATHPQFVGEALAAGKHVLCEFPLAPNGATARQLFAQARSAGLVLHTEFIGLLTQGHQWLRDQARQPLARLDLGFTGDFHGWVESEALAGHHATLAVARLHTLWDVLGPLQLQDATLETSADGYRLVAELSTLAPRPGTAPPSARLIEVRARGLPRGRTLDLTFADGTRAPAPPSESHGGLFLRDLEWFCASVGQGAASYVSDEAVLGVLDLADAITARIGQHP